MNIRPFGGSSCESEVFCTSPCWHLSPGRPELSAFKLVLADHTGQQIMPPPGNPLGIPEVLPQQIAAVATWIQGLGEGNEPGRP